MIYYVIFDSIFIYRLKFYISFITSGLRELKNKYQAIASAFIIKKR